MPTFMTQHSDHRPASVALERPSPVQAAPHRTSTLSGGGARPASSLLFSLASLVHANHIPFFHSGVSLWAHRREMCGLNAVIKCPDSAIREEATSWTWGSVVRRVSEITQLRNQSRSNNRIIITTWQVICLTLRQKGAAIEMLVAQALLTPVCHFFLKGCLAE